MMTRTTLTARASTKAIPSLLYLFFTSLPELRAALVLGAEGAAVERVEIPGETVLDSLGGSTVIRLVLVTTGTELVEVVVLPNAGRLTSIVEDVRLEEGVMIVVLAFDVVTKGLAEVMLGGGMTVNDGSGLLMVAAGVPLLMIVTPLLILSKFETTAGGGIVVEQWYVVPSTGVNEEPQQDIVTVTIGVVIVVVVVESAKSVDESLRVRKVSLVAIELSLIPSEVSRGSMFWAKVFGM